MPTITLQMQLGSLSKRKKQRLRTVMQRQQEIAQEIADLMPSIATYRWGNTRNDPVFHRWIHNLFPDNNGLRNHDANQVSFKVSENFESWQSNGYQGERPRYEKPRWARFCGCCDGASYEQNDDTWGVKLKLEPYNPEWFRVQVGEYQQQYLDRIGDDVSLGDAEIVEREDGGFTLNQTISIDQEQPEYEPSTSIGVDMGLNNIATVVVLQDGNVQKTEFFDGGRVGHYRRRMRQLRSEMQEAGQTAKVEEMRDLEQRFAKQQNHTIARRIIDIADQYEQPVIGMEELTGIRKDVNERMTGEVKTALNNWTFADLQSMITYKADLAGIPAKTVEARGTSSTCNKCGNDGQRPYQGNHERFYCPKCDYEADADFNGAHNIAQRT